MSQDADRLYQEGVTAIRAGNKATARQRLMEAIRIDRTHEQAWLWLSAAVDTDDERATCLENALTINPNNEAARRGLEKLGRPIPLEPPASEPEPLYPRPDPIPPPASTTPTPAISEPDDAKPDSSSVLVHSTSRVADLMSQPKGKRDEPDESWRSNLYSQEALASQGSYAAWVREEPVVKRSLIDLFNVWGTMLFFNLSGGFREEAKHGGFLHIIVNVAAGGLLQAIGIMILLLVLFAFSRGTSLPPMLRSITELIGGVGQSELTAELTTLLATFSQISLSPLIIGLLIYGVVSIPILFVAEMFRGLVVDFVAGQLKGRGDIMQTLHAITVALVVAQIAQLPMMFLFPLLPLGIGLVIWAGLRIYQFAVEAVAVGEVHRFGIFLAMGVLIISGAILGVLSSLLWCLISFLGALGQPAAHSASLLF